MDSSVNDKTVSAGEKVARGSAGLPSSEGAALWHVLSTAQAAERLTTGPGGGLTADEAARRLAVHGPNEIREQEGRSPWRMFFSQFTDFMIIVLLAAAVISVAYCGYSPATAWAPAYDISSSLLTLGGIDVSPWAVRVAVIDAA